MEDLSKEEIRRHLWEDAFTACRAWLQLCGEFPAQPTRLVAEGKFWGAALAIHAHNRRTAGRTFDLGVPSDLWGYPELAIRIEQTCQLLPPMPAIEVTDVQTWPSFFRLVHLLQADDRTDLAVNPGDEPEVKAICEHLAAWHPDQSAEWWQARALQYSQLSDIPGDLKI